MDGDLQREDNNSFGQTMDEDEQNVKKIQFGGTDNGSGKTKWK